MCFFLWSTLILVCQFLQMRSCPINRIPAVKTTGPVAAGQYRYIGFCSCVCSHYLLQSTYLGKKVYAVCTDTKYYNCPAWLVIYFYTYIDIVSIIIVSC